MLWLVDNAWEICSFLKGAMDLGKKGDEGRIEALNQGGCGWDVIYEILINKKQKMRNKLAPIK